MTLNPPGGVGHWVLEDEPMTDEQHSVLAELCVWLGEDFDPSLTRGEAALQLEELRHILHTRALWERSNG